MANEKKLSHKLQRYAGKIQQNRYMSAISNGLMSTLPFWLSGHFRPFFPHLPGSLTRTSLHRSRVLSD